LYHFNTDYPPESGEFALNRYNVIRCSVSYSIQLENGHAKMHKQGVNIQERNRAVGQILFEARMTRHMSVTACATCIGTSRRRYVAMEQGDASIGFAEMEVLMDYLEIPFHKVGSVMKREETHRQVELRFRPGETLRIVVTVLTESDDLEVGK
jgi:hypothetical protein